MLKNLFLELNDLNEGLKKSLSRVLKHYKDTGFALVTAWKDSASYSDNMKVMKVAEKLLRSAGFGFVKVRGVWVDESGKKSTEISFFVPNEGEYDLDKVCRRICLLNPAGPQDGYIISYGDGKAVLKLGPPSYNEKVVFNKISFPELEKAWNMKGTGFSRVKGKRIFKFEDIQIGGSNEIRG